jgi:hypothetical protein
MAGIFETQRTVQGGNPGFTPAKDQLVTDRANSPFVKNPNGRRTPISPSKKPGPEILKFPVPGVPDKQVEIQHYKAASGEDMYVYGNMTYMSTNLDEVKKYAISAAQSYYQAGQQAQQEEPEVEWKPAG